LDNEKAENKAAEGTENEAASGNESAIATEPEKDPCRQEITELKFPQT